jgi:hypothetical protein
MRTLVVERDPLGLAGAFNAFEGHGAIVTGDAGHNDAATGEVLVI